MTPKVLKALDQRLQKFLEHLTEPMGRSERRHWARVYVQGLLLDGERKSIEPMASRIEGSDVQALRQFVGQSPWPVEEVEQRRTRWWTFSVKRKSGSLTKRRFPKLANTRWA